MAEARAGVRRPGAADGPLHRQGRARRRRSASRDWEAFARGYNGPGFERHGYDRKIAAAYARQTGQADAETAGRKGTHDLLGRGSRGAAVVDLQQMLTALGYPLDDDGQFGPATERAVKDFQREMRPAGRRAGRA